MVGDCWDHAVDGGQQRGGAIDNVARHSLFRDLSSPRFARTGTRTWDSGLRWGNFQLFRLTGHRNHSAEMKSLGRCPLGYRGGRRPTSGTARKNPPSYCRSRSEIVLHSPADAYRLSSQNPGKKRTFSGPLPWSDSDGFPFHRATTIDVSSQVARCPPPPVSYPERQEGQTQGHSFVVETVQRPPVVGQLSAQESRPKTYYVREKCEQSSSGWPPRATFNRGRTAWDRLTFRYGMPTREVR
ncbi:hypothetical protein LZ31DRAFT_238420 [Colletotrichum somersetense]|nr:hypothetical protein LZ31DRAFT_238420 [Colletotrichum somersetense]